MKPTGNSSDPGERSSLQLGECARELVDLATAIGSPRIAAESESLRARLEAGRFNMAFLGQHKRGKSSLIDALVGDAVLPVGVLPVTTVVTVVRHGEQRSARVRFGEREWQTVSIEDLDEHVSEEKNPENRSGVSAVEVCLPSALLEDGMCLVDTPGIGSIFEQATRATRRMVPHVDAAVFVLGGDPPISEQELALVREVRARVEEIVFVLNKADRLPSEQVEQVRRFTVRALSGQLGGPAPDVFVVSAAEVQAGKPGRDWQQLVDRIQTLAREGGQRLLRSAESREGADLLDALVAELDDRRATFLRPIQESERHQSAVERAVARSRESLRDIGPLLAAEEKRLSDGMLARLDEFLRTALPAGRAGLLRSADASALPASSPTHADWLERARFLAREIVQGWRAEERERANAAYAAVSRRFVDAVQSDLRELGRYGAARLRTGTLDRPAAGDELGPEAMYHTDMLSWPSRSPIQVALERMLPGPWRDRLNRSRASRYLERLIVTNASRVAHDLRQRVLASGTRLEADLIARLGEISEAAERDLKDARAAMEHGAGAIAAELKSLDGFRKRADILRARLTGEDQDGASAGRL